MKALLTWLTKKGMPQEAAAELAALGKLVQTIDVTTNVLAATTLGLETVLEHHGLITKDILEACGPALEAKMRGPQKPEQAPETEPEKPA